MNTKAILLHLAALGLAGALGTWARYGATLLTQRVLGESFPYGTFLVNVAGAFLFGFVWMLLGSRGAMSLELRFYILTGFMGAFTTFSTLMFESSELMREDRVAAFAAYLGGQMVLGALAVAAGIAAGRAVG
ncbi:MAG: CrcB family protein [Candidatus Sumerlaeia bacterium]|nr:CrcB family protein [Candidatus Sumerlaeia bacterium]